MERYRPPESVVKKTKPLTAKQLFDLQWVKDRDLRRMDNKNHADGVFVGGTFFIHGVGHKGGKVR